MKQYWVIFDMMYNNRYECKIKTTSYITNIVNKSRIKNIVKEKQWNDIGYYLT